jgi:hypothetical protein
VPGLFDRPLSTCARWRRFHRAAGRHRLAVQRLKERASKLPEQRLEFSQAAAILGLQFAHGS